jgi:hypothetical protein
MSRLRQSRPRVRLPKFVRTSPEQVKFSGPSRCLEKSPKKTWNLRRVQCHDRWRRCGPLCHRERRVPEVRLSAIQSPRRSLPSEREGCRFLPSPVRPRRSRDRFFRDQGSLCRRGSVNLCGLRLCQGMLRESVIFPRAVPLRARPALVPQVRLVWQVPRRVVRFRVFRSRVPLCRDRSRGRDNKAKCTRVNPITRARARPIKEWGIRKVLRGRVPAEACRCVLPPGRI